MPTTRSTAPPKRSTSWLKRRTQSSVTAFTSSGSRRCAGEWTSDRSANSTEAQRRSTPGASAGAPGAWRNDEAGAAESMSRAPQAPQ